MHTITVVSQDASGTEVTSQKAFEVDTTPPNGATIQLVGDDNVLTSSEITSSTTVFISPEPGSTVVGALLDLKVYLMMLAPDRILSTLLNLRWKI